jgi:hypothetical protein
VQKLLNGIMVTLAGVMALGLAVTLTAGENGGEAQAFATAVRATSDEDALRVEMADAPRSVFRSRLEAHVEALLYRVRPLEEVERVPPGQRAALARELLEELDRAQDTVPRPGDLAERDDLALLSRYAAALKAFDGCAERDLRIVEGLE